MGRLLLVGRLATHDLRRRPVETVLLLLALMAATTTLTLGLALRAAAADPYQSTREATEGPDVTATVSGSAGLAGLENLAGAPGVAAHSGPYPVVGAELEASGRTSDVQAEGRDAAAAAVDRPDVVDGDWVRSGGVVLEAAFANALDVGVGDVVALAGRSFDVVGIALTAATAPYPDASCYVSPGCINGAVPDGRTLPPGLVHDPGLVWLAEADVRSIASPDALSYVLNLRLDDPDDAPGFVDAHQSTTPDGPRLESWQEIRDDATDLAHDAQILLLIGAWLLSLLAGASLAVLVGGRMADQTRRVGLLKAVGGTPGLVATVLLAEYVAVAVVAAAAGLAIGALTAPLLTGSGAGLVGSAGTPALTVPVAVWVTAVALGVAVVATIVPTVRAARSSTVDALAEPARPPHRVGRLIAVSARLPAPLLLAVRIAVRRPRRVVLAVVSIAITVSGIYVVLVLNTFLGAQPATGAYDEAQVGQLRQVLLVFTAILLALAAVDVVVITWTTVLDNRRSSALARALGATPGQVSTALAAAQVLPALVGAVLGVFPGGFALFYAVNAITGGDSSRATLPSLWELIVLVVAAVLVVTALTVVPARLGARRPVAEVLRADVG